MMTSTIRAFQTPLIRETTLGYLGLRSAPFVKLTGLGNFTENQARSSISNASQNLDHLIIPDPSPFEVYEDVEFAEKVKKMSLRMRKLEENSLEELVMIDTIQRLGIDHLFQEEIMAALYRHFLDQYSSKSHHRQHHQSNHLHQVSLRFRLLRQEGYNISSTSAFEEFVDRDGKLNQELLGKDVGGLISLFEASQMSMHGELILDEANALSKQLLSASLETLDESHATQVQNALKHPIQKSLAKYMTQDFLSTMSNAKGWRNELRKLAKMDFKMNQTIYHNEILHISNWWKKLGLSEELKFARDEPLKWHTWSLAVLSDPSLSEQRIEMTKMISFIYIIDDIFDVYGTPEDLSLFTEAVKRWEYEKLEELPEYMKICLKALFDVTNESSHQIWLKHGFNPKDSLQKAWMDLCNAFSAKSKWFGAGHLPTAAEYLTIGTTSSGVHVVLTHMIFLLGGGTHVCESNKQVLEEEYTRMISSTARILRLWDDLGSSKDEDQDGHDGSYIKCYMNEKRGVSVESAREHVFELISDAWKSLNEDSTTQYSSAPSSARAFKRGCLNMARMVPLMYSYSENHRLPDLQKFINSLLYQRL